MNVILQPVAEVIATGTRGGVEMRLGGSWTLQALSGLGKGNLAVLEGRLKSSPAIWNCLEVERFDSAGALLLWQVWGRQYPRQLQIRPEHRRVFARLEAADREPPAEGAPPRSPLEILIVLGSMTLQVRHHVQAFLVLVGQLVLDILHIIRHPGDLPGREISANIYKSGVLAMPVTALVGILIGVVLSYLSALQLRQFGADTFVINILGLGIIRELGPMLVAVLVAGRSGSAMTAQLGVMRVTEEIDALATMGVPRSLRLVFPKVVGLGVSMPLLVLWAIFNALLGGMVAAQLQLDISYGFFIETLPRAVPVANLWIALGKGVLFGMAIALVACHFGLRVKPNTDSLAANTTASVVSAITLVIFIDALMAIATRTIGLPRL